ASATARIENQKTISFIVDTFIFSPLTPLLPVDVRSGSLSQNETHIRYRLCRLVTVMMPIQPSTPTQLDFGMRRAGAAMLTERLPAALSLPAVSKAFDEDGTAASASARRMNRDESFRAMMNISCLV